MIRYGEYLHVRVLEKVGERGGNIDRILGEIGIYIYIFTQEATLFEFKKNFA